MSDDVLLGCRDLLHHRRWVAESLSWTVVEPLGEALHTIDIIARLGGSSDSIITPEEAAEAGTDFVDERFLGVVLEMGRNVVLLEDNGYQGSRPEVLRVLSTAARVHNAYWNVTGNGRLSCAAHGSVLAVIDVLDETRRSGSAPDILDADLQPLLDDRGSQPHFLKAAFLALIEIRTGVSLAACLSSASGARVHIPTQVAADPRPPGALGTVDPELDVQLRLAPEPARRGELLRLVDNLAHNFQLAHEDAVHHARALVAQGGSRRQGDNLPMYVLVQRINREYVPRVNAGEIDKDNQLGRQLNAARGIEAAAARPGTWPDPLDAFYWASLAYTPDRWKTIRNDTLAALKRQR
jgi:Family of unknown function (DUF6461)